MHGTVIVAVVAVRMVQVFVHHVVYVIAVRYRFMPAAGAVPVIPCMRSTGVVRRALLRVGPAHLEPMLFHAAVALVVQTPVVEVIDVAAMLEASMAAVRAVLMRMPFVNTGLRLSGRLHGSISLSDALEEESAMQQLCTAVFDLRRPGSGRRSTAFGLSTASGVGVYTYDPATNEASNGPILTTVGDPTAVLAFDD